MPARRAIGYSSDALHSLYSLGSGSVAAVSGSVGRRHAINSTKATVLILVIFCLGFDWFETASSDPMMIRKYKCLAKFWELEVEKPTHPYPGTIVGTNEGGDWERIMSSNEEWSQSADEMGKSSVFIDLCFPALLIPWRIISLIAVALFEYIGAALV